MSLQSISLIMQKLDLSWYENKKKVFKREGFYVEKYDKIQVDIDEIESTQIEEDQWVEKKIEISFAVDLNSYCWNSYFPTSIQQSIGTYEEIGLPIDAIDVSSTILSAVERVVENFTEPVAITNYVLRVIDLIKKEIDVLRDRAKDEFYGETLNYLFQKFQEQLWKHFHTAKVQVDLIESFEHKLQFKLPQKQLAALLYILNRADFLNTADYNDTSMLEFCGRFFQFYHGGKYKKTENIESFKEKYREISRNPNNPTLIEVRDKLLKALREMK